MLHNELRNQRGKKVEISQVKQPWLSNKLRFEIVAQLAEKLLHSSFCTPRF